jgi:hypothetical protein
MVYVVVIIRIMCTAVAYKTKLKCAVQKIYIFKSYTEMWLLWLQLMLLYPHFNLTL